MKTKSDSSFILYSYSVPMPRPSSFIPHPSSFARGVTLVEMLVVLVIISMLAAVALQALPSGDQRYREAARMVNVYLNSARSAAMENGRPAGVILKRMNATTTHTYNAACNVVEQCETPPPYSGETIGATLQIQEIPNATALTIPTTITIPPVNSGYTRKRFKATFASGAVIAANLNSGDYIRLNGQGPLYYVEYADDSSSVLAIQFHIDYPTASPPQFPWPDSAQSGPVSFLVQRQPSLNGGAVFSSSAEPLQLPAGAAIDLFCSGTTGIPTFNYNANNIIIMFAPSGEIASIDVGAGPTTVTGPIYLLVGKMSRIRNFQSPPNGDPLSATPADEEKPNWADLTNYWVTIQPRSGMINTAEVAFVNTSAVNWATATSWYGGTPDYFNKSRSYADEAQSAGR